MTLRTSSDGLICLVFDSYILLLVVEQFIKIPFLIVGTPIAAPGNLSCSHYISPCAPSLAILAGEILILTGLDSGFPFLILLVD